ncbi:polyamine ABC transporter substrate-binding protein [Endozoicomonadaceae bacterium StTr2]
MKNAFVKSLLATAAACVMTSAVSAKESQELNVYNWTDYIAEDTIPVFEKQTGIAVNYDVFDSNETLEGKLLSGRSGFDVVAPTSEFMAVQIKAGAFQKLDKSKLPNWKNLDPKLMKQLEAIDPGNQYAFPYLWGSTGMGINEKKVREVLGKDIPLNSWDLVFNPENMKKLQQCGVAFLDAPTEMFPHALAYLGLEPLSENKKDYKKAEKVLSAVRPYVKYFHSSRYITDLASGEICVAVGWSGDMLIARDRAEEAETGQKIVYVTPKEGSGLWFDMFGIPADAPNPENAHKFLNYLMRPEVIAEITNYVSYANPNSAATALVDAEVRNDPGIYPDEETASVMFTYHELPSSIIRVMTRGWNRVKSGT